MNVGQLVTAALGTNTEDEPGGFSIEESDPVEAKCAALRSLIQKMATTLEENQIEKIMGREQILKCHQLYGRHFQHHFPILHTPTHNLLTTPPNLLLAMVLAGAHFSNDAVTADDVLHLTMKLMKHIEMEQVMLPTDLRDLALI